MKICQIKSRAMMASFRIPETQTFHQTLPLPPLTTLIGLLGAAMGNEYSMAFQYARENTIYFGVSGFSKGEAKDLWNYCKIKKRTKPLTLEERQQRANYSVVLKEYLFDNSFAFCFGHPDEQTVLKIHDAFSQPVFPLVAGSSDDLLKVVSIKIFDCEPIQSHQFRNTVLTGDLAGKYDVSADVFNKPLHENIRSPKTFSLPVDFTFDGDIRKIAERRSFTFVGDEILLKTSIPCYSIEGDNIELYAI